MPLPNGLRNKTLIFNCPNCNHPLAKNGAWFAAMAGFECVGCKRYVPMTYSDKLALFDRHAHLMDKKA